MNKLVEVRLLGPFEVLAGGQPANVGGGKRRGLLALLALRCGRVVGVDSLIDALWADDLPAAPRNAVQHHVARLRAALGSEAIAATPDGYALAHAAVDALRFEDLLHEARDALRAGDAVAGAESVARGLELWRGPALHGLTDTAWFGAEARRLESLRVDALEEQFEAALVLGEHRDVVPALGTALEENPFRERLWGQLMLALYRSGRQPDALEAFREARRVFSEELALEPGPELRRLQDAILSHDPAIAPLPAPRRRRGTLPAPSTSFVDREEALAQVLALVREHRLVTLTGLPGVGKSRLALEAARSVEHEFADGAWFVDLARAGGEDDVVRLVAHAVDVRGADPLARVVGRLRDADAILWLDGCGRVVGEAARVASAVVAGCPDVRVLTTSREVLHVPGEVRVMVEPFRVPDPGRSDGVDSPAVQLFVERARAARPGFELTAEAAPLVAKISRHVDGLPLAIELAAARAHALGLVEILSVVEHRLELLGDVPASDANRASLQALVEWCYDVLHEDEKSLLHKVAVHRGGASVPSLVAAAASDGLDEPTVTYLLGVLVDKSILAVSFPAEGARYDMLETVREYALERLAESGRLAAARRAHAESIAALAEAARAELRGADWRAWVRRLELENDNVWAALTYARDARESGIAARLAALAWYFVLAERVAEGRRFLERALAATSGDLTVAERLELHAFRCYLATEELDLDTAIEIGERALAGEATEAAVPELGLVEAALGLAVAEAGDVERGAALAGRGYARLDAGENHWESAAASLFCAQVAAAAGDVATVAAMAAEARRHAQATGFDAFLVPAMLLEAWVAERRHDSSAATVAYRRTLDLAGRIGFADHAAFALSGLASSALAGGDVTQAEELERRALATAEAARASWAAAHARVELGRILAAAGDAKTAAKLYRTVLAWSKARRAHGPRESLFVVLSQDPAAAAAVGLAGLGDGRDEITAATAPA
ncbi:AfsR/SARP family transcriptional regulator [Georgenia yuyongxinii]|uniref:AfsR/SARP family transcriptional regulator n=1 Tax=Georgenia yuyongxinii TaxID=2589797 RepID=A0A5B8C3X8_9MICO|nr:BTAD domain-containing putative transcriptional regulator [Georgenia yuyongxinii]QDC23812.1 AfsR/SARP family transcriptional regulator [Georgenia yuyongxinii]